MTTVDVYLTARCELGESPVWDDRLGELQWVDIKRGQIHRLVDATREHTVLDLGQSIGSIVGSDSGDCWMTGLRNGAALIDYSGSIRRFVEIDASRPEHRMNDGACDSDGRFWTGTLNEREGPPSDAVYCVRPDFTVERVVQGVGLSNGIAWSPDNLTMYRVDSAFRTIFRADFAVDDGQPRNETALVVITGGGEPDGLAVDSDGCLWVAIWDGASIDRYTPTGALDRRVELPVTRPTSCAFGGSASDILFVTSAGGFEGASADSLDGAIFALDVGVTGATVARFRDL